jgi:FtsZ-interacting cell division protein ZipA
MDTDLIIVIVLAVIVGLIVAWDMRREKDE